MPRMSQGFAPLWTASPWRSNSPPLESACSAPPRLQTGSTSRSRCWSTARGIDQSDSVRSARRSSGALNSSSPMSALLLQRLGVFQSGFALDAVEWINEDLAAGDALQSLSALVDGSLIQEHDRGSRAWFTMLATVGEYAREQLITRNELARLQECHATFYSQLTATAGAEIIGPQQEAWLSRLTDEGSNVRAAVEYLLDNRRWDDAVDLVWSLDWYWGIAGRLIEVGNWMQRVLDDGLEASERARNIARLEVLAVGMWRKPDEAAIDPLTECADFFHSDGDLLTEAKARGSIGLLHMLKSPPDFEAADESLQQASDLAASLADPFGSAMVGFMVGRAHLMRGDLPKAIETLDASLAAGRSVGDRSSSVLHLNARGWGVILSGDLQRADECFREHLLTASTIGHEPGIGYALEGLFATAAIGRQHRTRGSIAGGGRRHPSAEGQHCSDQLSFHNRSTSTDRAVTAGRAV